MMRKPQILGSRARGVRRALLTTLPALLWLGGCGLKGPLYLPPAAAPTATTSPAPTPATTAAPATPNTPAQ